jgi:DNA-binding response OmpR family regulator
MEDALGGDGHVTASAGGGRAGLDAFAAAQRSAQPFTLVVTDLGMPDVDGRRVAEGVKRLAPTTPVIMLTGWGSRMIAENDIPEHVDRVLSKPPRIAEFRAAIRDLFGAAND